MNIKKKVKENVKCTCLNDLPQAYKKSKQNIYKGQNI